MVYWYKVLTGWSFQSNIIPEIEKVQIIKETECMIFMTDGRREQKETERHQYFDTWKKAHDFIVDGIKSEIRETRKKLSEKINNLKIAQSLKEE